MPGVKAGQQAGGLIRRAPEMAVPHSQGLRLFRVTVSCYDLLLPMEHVTYPLEENSSTSFQHHHNVLQQCTDYKAREKTETDLHVLQKLELSTFLDIIKAIYDKSRAHTILSGEKLRAFPLRSGIRQGFPLLPTLIQQGFGSPSHSNQRRRNERDPYWKR